MTPDQNCTPTTEEMRQGGKVAVAVRMACMDLLARNLRADRGMKAIEVMT